MTAPDLRLELVSNPLYLCGVRGLVGETLKRLGFGDKDAGQTALAVDEALVNVIRHGYDKRSDGRIWLTVSPARTGDGRIERVTIVIEDEAKQVDPAAIKGRDLSDVRPGGLGVHIIREVMDEVTYEKRNGVGMRLTLVKRMKEGGPPPTACGECGCAHG